MVHWALNNLNNYKWNYVMINILKILLLLHDMIYKYIYII